MSDRYKTNLMTVVFILLVVFVHHKDYTVNYFEFLWDNNLSSLLSYFAVGGFFFLSGYKLIKSKKETSVSNFLKNRFLRIYPLYWFSVISFVFLIVNENNPFNFIVHMLGLQAIFLNFGQTYMTLYFISILVIFYLLFLYLRDKSGLSLVIYGVIILFMFVALKFVSLFTFPFIEDRLILYFPFFFVGIFYGKNFFPKKSTKYLSIVSFAFFVLLILFRLFLYKEGILYLGLDYLLVNFCFVPLLVWFMSLKIKSIFSGLIKSLSVSSYVVYLFHRPFFEIFSQVFSTYSLFGWLLLWVAIVPILFLVSYFIQLYYNKIVFSFTKN